MGNAQDIVKETADWVTDVNTENGVAKAIRHWCYNRKRESQYEALFCFVRFVTRSMVGFLTKGCSNLSELNIMKRNPTIRNSHSE